MTNEAKRLRVLWATDGSAHSESAIPLLRDLVLPVAGHITVLTVAPQTLLGGVRPDPAFIARVTPASRRAALLEAEEIAGRWLTELDPGTVPAEAVARWGHPVQEILKGARAVKADLLVLGAKGHSNLHLLLLGSVVQAISQLTPQPLLVARPGTSEIKRILVAYDDSAPARKALSFLGSLALPQAAEIVLLRVLEPPDKKGRRRGPQEPSPEELQERREALRALGAAAESFTQRGLAVRVETLVGVAAQRLQEAARKERADLVVVGSRKPSATAHYLIGSTAEKIVRHVAASVLIVR